MTVICDDKIGTARHCTIDKLVVVRVNRDEVSVKVFVNVRGVAGVSNTFYNVFGNICAHLLADNFLVFQYNIGSNQQFVLLFFKRPKDWMMR